MCAIAATRQSEPVSPGIALRRASNACSACVKNGSTCSGATTAMKSEPPMWPMNAPPPEAARAESSRNWPRLRTVSSDRAMPIESAYESKLMMSMWTTAVGLPLFSAPSISSSIAREPGRFVVGLRSRSRRAARISALTRAPISRRSNGLAM